jgi:RNA polymerase sigma-70 factor (ECF subfamily)
VIARAGALPWQQLFGLPLSRSPSITMLSARHGSRRLAPVLVARPTNGARTDDPEPAEAPESGRASPRQARDRAIVCDLLARRHGAVAAAWHHFVPFVTRVTGRLAGPNRDVDDLTQEVFERFFRRIDGLRSPDAVRAFLYGIALRVVKRDLRYRWLRRNLKVSTDTERAVAVTPDPEAREAARRLLGHLHSLKPEQRSLIVARYVEGMELRAVACAHGLSFNTMRRRLEHAWQRLEHRLDEDDLLVDYVRERRAGEEPR